ncbi:MAG: hypothetical protein ACKO37_04290 [Vampirovibrionales bacterium]
MQKEILIDTEWAKSIRIGNISTSDFHWVYEALVPDTPLEKVSMKTLRAIMARNVQLFRCDIPRNTVQVNINKLTEISESEEQYANVFGVTLLENSGSHHLQHPYTLTQVANKLGLENWSAADKLIKKIESTKDTNIKNSDNKYHQRIGTGTKDSSCVHKYSDDCVVLLRKVLNAQPYEIQLPRL